MRLIDADNLGNEFDEQMYYLQWEVDPVANPHRFQRAEGINWCRNTLNDAPTVDAVEVVRCKDCKYHTMHYDDHTCDYLDVGGLNEDFFCASGERKSDAGGID